MQLLIILCAWIFMTLVFYIGTAFIVSVIYINREDVATKTKVGCAWLLTSFIAALLAVMLLVKNGYLI